MKPFRLEDMFGIVNRAFGSALSSSWSSPEEQGASATRALMLPAAAEYSIERSPLHQRHAIRAFISRHPLAIDQLVELIKIANMVVRRDCLQVGEVRLTSDLDDDVVLGLHMRLDLPLEDFESARSDIRQEYRSSYPDGSQLVLPVVLRVLE